MLYGLTPPKVDLSEEGARALAQKQLARLENTAIDGLVIYDLQDESGRTGETRTFDFCGTLRPELYWREYLHEAYDAVIYKAVGNYSAEEFADFVANNSNLISVFVGASSKNDTPRLSLAQAYKIHRELASSLALGGICIPERHVKKGDEDLRVAGKVAKGCEFFITQAVYNLENAKRFIDDYAALSIRKVPIIFTFTPCGCEKTLAFMRWLGIDVPAYFEERLLGSSDPLETSVQLSLDMFDFLYKYGIAKGISVGANVESISTRRVEIEASIELLRGIRAIIDTTIERV